MSNKKIAIIGIGNMGTAIVKGLVKSDFISASDIHVYVRKQATLDKMVPLGISIFRSNEDAVRDADVVIVAVKPYHIEGVLNEIKPILTEEIGRAHV